MVRFWFVIVALTCAPGLLMAQGTGGGTINPCYQESKFTCAEQGIGYQGHCLYADCVPVNADGSKWECVKEKGLTLWGRDPRKWWDVHGAPQGVAGSTRATFLPPDTVGCGFVIWCGCDPENTWKCVDGDTDNEFIPEQQRIVLPLDCVGM